MKAAAEMTDQELSEELNDLAEWSDLHWVLRARRWRLTFELAYRREERKEAAE